MKVLVVGGAGYIDSHMLSLLTDASHQLVTLDSLSNGYRDTVHYGDFIETTWLIRSKNGAKKRGQIKL